MNVVVEKQVDFRKIRRPFIIKLMIFSFQEINNITTIPKIAQLIVQTMDVTTVRTNNNIFDAVKKRFFIAAKMSGSLLSPSKTNKIIILKMFLHDIIFQYYDLNEVPFQFYG